MEDRLSLEPLSSTTLGQYKVRARIGSGGMGDVYDAEHTQLQKRVAIKTLRARFLEDPTVVARFLREGQLASRIRHPNIVDVTDVGMIGGLPCLVMEHLEGESLSHRIKREKAMRLDELVDLLLPIIGAVDFAHEHGVLHRDIKPSNIFLSRSWNGEIVPKVLDFGISKLVHESAQAALTTDSAFVGTPQYASPELMRADKATDGRSDQYSMGIVLYEASTGVRPFTEKAGNFVALAMAICAGELVPPRHVKPDLPEAFERVILRAVALRPDDRFLSMKQLGEALLPFASERARVIWAPTFRSGAGDPASRVDNTALLGLPPPPGGSSASTLANPGVAEAMTPGSGAGHALGRTGPFYPSSAGMNASPGFPSGSVPPSFAQSGQYARSLAPSGSSSIPHGSLPHGQAYDGTPSYGGGGVSTSGAIGAPQAKGNGALFGVIAVGALALGVGIVGFVAMRQKAAPIAEVRDPGAAQGATAAPAPVGTFEMTVTVTPPTAEIAIDGVPAGTGAVRRAFPRDGAPHTLTATARGYQTLDVPFNQSQLPPSVIQLQPVPAPPPPTPIAGGTPRHGRPAPPPPPPASTTPKGKNPDTRPKTDNINPWE